LFAPDARPEDSSPLGRRNALLGPITGPLTLRLYRSLQAGRPLLAILYLAAIVETFVDLPLVLNAPLRALQHHA
jgi:hypothetical protein